MEKFFIWKCSPMPFVSWQELLVLSLMFWRMSFGNSGKSTLNEIKLPKLL